MTKNTIDIIILTFNRLEYLKTLVKYLHQHTRWPFRLIIVDNGSTDGSREYIFDLMDEEKIYAYIFTKDNLPMSQAFTEGFHYAVESDLFVTCPDDMLPPRRDTGPCWLEVLVAKMNQDKDIGCINFVSSRRSYEKFKQKH